MVMMELSFSHMSEDEKEELEERVIERVNGQP